MYIMYLINFRTKIFCCSIKVDQLIIDECGMCLEPESLIPIARYNPKQIVLIGDHKQLR